MLQQSARVSEKRVIDYRNKTEPKPAKAKVAAAEINDRHHLW